MSPGLGPWRRTTASYCSVLSLKIPAMAMRLERLAAFFPSRAASTLPSSPSKYRIALSNRLTSVRVTRVVHLPENRTWIYKLIYFLVRTFTPRTRQRRRKHWPAGISASEPPVPTPTEQPALAGISNGNFVSGVPEVLPPRTFGPAFLLRAEGETKEKMSLQGFEP